MEYIPLPFIVQQIKQIQKRDILYIVSDIFELSKIAREHGEIFDREYFLDTLMEAIGTDGTLMIPTFNWDFCKGITFDYKKTRCKTGALGTAALKNGKYIRTKHPIYSFAVRGKMAMKLYDIDPQNSFGKGSCFDFMCQNQAKALVIGLPAMKGMTFLHHAEQMIGVPFRYHKYFTAGYTDKDGRTEQRTYSMYVRNLDMDVKEQTEPFNTLIEALGVCQTKIINAVPFRIIFLQDLMELLRMDIVYNDCRNLYVYKGQLKSDVNKIFK